MSEEKWKAVADGYWVSSRGRVYAGPREVRCGFGHTRNKRGRILGMNVSPAGYYRVNIHREVLHVHTLVAKAFLGDPSSDDMTVNHKDLDKKNNRVENLEWVSSAENVRHAWTSGAYSFQRSVRCIDTGQVFSSIHEAAESENRSPGNLCTHLKGGQRTFAGKTWEYVDPEWPKRRDAA